MPCIGAHYTNVSLVAKFDPAAPSELLYDGTGPDAKIVGLSYLVFHPGGPPDGFAGTNDHWHQHNANGGLCYNKGGVVIGGEEQTREECAARGGEKRELTDIWMAHAGSFPASSAAGACSPASARSSAARSAAPPGTERRAAAAAGCSPAGTSSAAQQPALPVVADFAARRASTYPVPSRGRATPS